MFEKVKNWNEKRKIEKLKRYPMFFCKFKKIKIEKGYFGKGSDRRSFNYMVGNGLEETIELTNPVIFFDKKRNLRIEGDENKFIIKNEQLSFHNMDLYPTGLGMTEKLEPYFSYFSSTLQLRTKDKKDFYISCKEEDIESLRI